MMTVGRWAVGQAEDFSISLPEHKSATIRNILMVNGRIIEKGMQSVTYKNGNSAYLKFIIMSLDIYCILIFMEFPHFL